MKKILIAILFLILLIPFKVNAGTVNISGKFLNFYYYDIQMNQLKNKEFELQNMSGEKIIDLTMKNDGSYTIPFEIYHKEYNPDDNIELMLFDEEHRAIIEEIISNDNYSDYNTYNEYISNIRTDDIFFSISEGREETTNWGIRGKIPLKIVEKTSNNTKAIYIFATVSLTKNNRMELSVYIGEEMHLIDKDANIREIHNERFIDEISTSTFEYDSITIPDGFNDKYTIIKAFGNYGECIELIEGESWREGYPPLCFNTLIDNSAFETIDISDSINLKEYFKKLAKDSNIEILDIEDKTILKIQDGKIIPLKKGETSVKMKIKDNIYNFRIKVTGDISNPNTSFTSIIFILLFISFISILLLISFNKMKYPQV